MPKKHPEHVNLERWLVSYADFITLLFAFFVILYATSKADAQKFKAVADSIKVAFDSEMVDQAGKSSGKTIVGLDDNIEKGGVVINMPNGRMNIKNEDNEELKKIADVLEESMSFELGATDYAEKMQIKYEDRGVVVRMSAKDFFSGGDSEVKGEGLVLLDQMAKILKGTKRRIRIEGHTDDLKSNSAKYPSNWELSTARAAWIVRYLIFKHDFDPKLLEAAGYAEFHPVASNDNEKGRSKNRRVEIVVLSKDQP
jgi:chemotaxis protein MotB